MKVVTSEEMRGIDKETIGGYGLSGSVLMERAGLSVAAKVRELFGKRKVIVLSGGGNNGGDGIVAARELFNRGWNVRVLLLSKEDRLSPDCLAQYRTAKKMGVPTEFRTGLSEKDLHSAVVVDAILGTGINKPVTPPLADVIRFLNSSNVEVISVDLPSGISSDNGRVMGEAVRADYTITFGLPKIGHLLHPGAEFTGRLFVEDIGFPEGLLKSEALKVQTVEGTDGYFLVPERPDFSYKGDYGHVLVIAGSRGKTGAAIMTARACLRTGAGMVTIGAPETLADIFQTRVTEEMILPLSDTGNGTLSSKALDGIFKFVADKTDVIAIGPGLGVSDSTEKIVAELVQRSAVPLVIDADGINSLQGRADILKKARSPIILTPHAGEMAGLLSQRPQLRRRKSGKDMGGEELKTQNSKLKTEFLSLSELRDQIERDRINTARSFTKDKGIYLVLKGAPAIVAEPDGRVFINTTGNPGMATAGSGDVLTGMIAAFLGQGLNPLNASVLGTYMHGLAGDIAASEKGLHSLIATDIIDGIPAAFAGLKNNK